MVKVILTITKSFDLLIPKKKKSYDLIFSLKKLIITGAFNLFKFHCIRWKIRVLLCTLRVIDDMGSIESQS